MEHTKLYTVVLVLDANICQSFCFDVVEASVLMSTSVECMIGSKPKSLIEFGVMMCIILQFDEIARLLCEVIFSKSAQNSSPKYRKSIRRK